MTGRETERQGNRATDTTTRRRYDKEREREGDRASNRVTR